MTAPESGSGASRTKTADDLLEALLDKDEYREVLRYARDHSLHKDDTVLFMVGMLKVFAYVWGRLTKLAEILDYRIVSVRRESHLAEQRMAETVGEHVKLMHKLLDEHVRRIGHSAAQMNVAAGEMRVMREQIELITRDAERTLAAYDALKATPDTKSLTTLIDKRLTEALTKRVSGVDDIFRERMLQVIYYGMDRYIWQMRIYTGIIVVVAGILIYLVRR